MTSPQIDSAAVEPADDFTHAVCEEQMEAVPRIAVCGADCTDATEGGGLPYCELCVVLLRYHLATCRTCLDLFLAAKAANGDWR